MEPGKIAFIRIYELVLYIYCCDLGGDQRATCTAQTNRNKGRGEAAQNPSGVVIRPRQGTVGKIALRRIVECVKRTFERWWSGLFIDVVMGRVRGSRRDPRKDERESRKGQFPCIERILVEIEVLSTLPRPRARRRQYFGSGQSDEYSEGGSGELSGDSLALSTVPRNPTQCHPKTLGFSSLVYRRPSSFDSARVSTSLVAINAFGPVSGPVISKLSNRSFVVRAESISAEGEVEDTETVEDNEEEEAESELEAEGKLPRKPRVKLGDIMGILNKRAIEASDQERPIPDLRTGDIVEIRMASLRKKRRLSRYKGIVISKQNAGLHTTIRIRRIIAGIGVEIVFPV
ncbi:ribosomal protein L19 family protein [Actinidia rufa]|uniref:Ribosomal protein L19 family protein n=1 Tax=Actinidia rufa TaxID=165716 RepID=A0A7J0H0P4_9ERIC|nr:ribosomal protein L19 family protein [Actinidia rufa]